MNYKELGDKYYNFNNLLGTFLEDTYDDSPDASDLKTVRRFISEISSKMVTKAVVEGKEILGLKEFPHEWISDTTNRRPKAEDSSDTPEGYYEWVEWMVETLEEEAKKAGKWDEKYLDPNYN